VNWHVLAIGKPKLVFAKLGVEEYAKRLAPFISLSIDFLKAQPSREEESAALLKRSTGTFRIALDERGEQLTSRAFAEKISVWEQRSVKTIALLVGGAEGHSDELRRAADWQWALSKLTFQHELALVVLLEQIYRAHTIKAGLPYHRD
jgi:23S rRNA (pseudouridine1915-N3)-methyltransferase